MPVEMPADRRPGALRKAEGSRTGGIILPTMRALAIVVPAFVLLASAPARPDERLATAGKQRAAASRLAWEIREAGHPLLGPIRFAHTTTPVMTPAGNGTVFSN